MSAYNTPICLMCGTDCDYACPEYDSGRDSYTGVHPLSRRRTASPWYQVRVDPTRADPSQMESNRVEIERLRAECQVLQWRFQASESEVERLRAERTTLQTRILSQESWIKKLQLEQRVAFVRGRRVGYGLGKAARERKLFS